MEIKFFLVDITINPKSSKVLYEEIKLKTKVYVAGSGFCGYSVPKT